MADRVSPATLKASFRTLRGYLDDLAGAQFKDHSTKLRLFVNYFQKDDVVRYLADRLHTRLADVLEAAQKPEPRLPDDGSDRIAFVYGVLYHLKHGHKLEVRELLARTFPGSSIEAKWDELRKQWLTVLAEGFATMSREIDARAGFDPLEPVSFFAEVLATTSGGAPAETAATDDDETDDEAAEPEDTGAALTLRDAVARLEGAQKGDLSIELEILALEKLKRKQDRKRLDEVVASFANVSPELDALARAEAGLSAKASDASEPKKPAAKKAAGKKKPG